MVKTDLTIKTKELNIKSFHTVPYHPYYSIGSTEPTTFLFTFKDNNIPYEIYIKEIARATEHYYVVSIYVMEDEGHGPFERYLYRAMEKADGLIEAVKIAERFYKSV